MRGFDVRRYSNPPAENSVATIRWVIETLMGGDMGVWMKDELGW
jgi:hypothetical protein